MQVRPVSSTWSARLGANATRLLTVKSTRRSRTALSHGAENNWPSYDTSGTSKWQNTTRSPAPLGKKKKIPPGGGPPGGKKSFFSGDVEEDWDKPESPEDQEAVVLRRKASVR